MFGLREVLESTLEEILARENLVHLSENELESIVADMIPSLLDDAANLALVRIKKNAPSELKKHQRDRKGFEKRLNESWKRPLDLLDLVICMSVEVGTAFTRKFLNESGVQVTLRLRHS